jgi:transposase-like protein
VAAAARALGVTPKALTDAWQRRGLATLPSQRAPRRAGERLDRDRVVAEQALQLASQVGLGRAAATLGVTPGVLHRAWQRHGLDRPARKSRQRPAAPPATAADGTGARGRTRRSRNGREREEGGEGERP